MIVWPISSAGHVDRQVAGDVVGLGRERDGVHDLVDDALLADHEVGLALEHDRHVGR